MAFPAFGLAALVLLGAAPAASSRPAALQREVATVDLSQAHAPQKHYRIACAAGLEPERNCLRLATLEPGSEERCLQIWGGPSRAVVTIPATAKRFAVTRSNSCQIERWKKLQAALN